MYLVAGDSPPRQDRFRLTERTRETHTRETEFTQLITNYKVRHIITTYTDIQLCAQLNHKCNVNVSPYKNPRTRPYLIQIMQWHDRWRPHASQWPKPAYHTCSLKPTLRSMICVEQQRAGRGGTMFASCCRAKMPYLCHRLFFLWCFVQHASNVFFYPQKLKLSKMKQLLRYERKQPKNGPNGGLGGGAKACCCCCCCCYKREYRHTWDKPLLTMCKM